MTTRDETARGEIADLRRALEVFQHETRKQLVFLELAIGTHSSKLSDLNAKVDMMIDGQAEIKAILIARDK